jgi:quercetin dioxygenase-like cupin family protein
MRFLPAGLLALLSVTGTMYAQPETAMLDAPKVFAFQDLPLRKMANGGESRDVATGKLKTGEAVSIHESMQPKGLPPNPEHRIEHSEFIFVQEGTLEYLHDGKVERAGPGSVIYVAYGTMHTVRNVGDGPAKYAVIAIGGDVAK